MGPTNASSGLHVRSLCGREHESINRGARGDWSHCFQRGRAAPRAKRKFPAVIPALLRKVSRIGPSLAPRERVTSPTMQTILGQSASARDSSRFEWVGNVDGAIYYRATYSMAKLWPQERVFFRSEASPTRGYRRSRVAGC